MPAPGLVLFHTNTTTMTNNVLHGLLCIFTGGLWLPCWLLACCCDDDEGNRHHHHRNNNNNTTIINQNINSSGERRPLRGKAQQAKKKGNTVNNGTSSQVHETLADGATFKGHKAKGQRQGFGVYCYPQGEQRLARPRRTVPPRRLFATKASGPTGSGRAMAR